MPSICFESLNSLRSIRMGTVAACGGGNLYFNWQKVAVLKIWGESDPICIWDIDVIYLRKVPRGMNMRETETAPIRTQIFLVNLLVVAVAVVLAMGATLLLTLLQDRQILDRNLMNSAQVIARVPMVVEDLTAGKPTQELWDFLDQSIAQISDIDVIIVADVQGIQYYAPDQNLIGRPYEGTARESILNGSGAFTSDDTGASGAERCAYAPVLDENGTLLGFVMVGIYMRSVSASLWRTVLSFTVIAAAAAALGGLISTHLSNRIKHSLMGYEPAAFLGLFHQREDILEALEEGVMAIDADTRIIYLNQAAEEMLNLNRAATVGQLLLEVSPRSTLGRVLRTKRPEYNVPLVSFQKVRILSDRVPIREDGRVVGVLAIFRNRTEVARLADDLTGVRHMVEALRAYTHEFLNKLHVILGLLQLGEAEKAEAYIMDVTSIHQKAVGMITDSIQNPSVAALLVGKTSRCAELGIRLTLDPWSRLSADENLLPAEAYVTILGNLIENAVDAMNHHGHGLKEISVSIREREDSLLLCVEDTGPGMKSDTSADIFRQGFSTKGEGRGTGLALVREVVDAYQGEIRVESEPGVGTSFFLTFRRDPKKENINV